MEIMLNAILSTTATSFLWGIVIWLSRNIVITRLVKSVEHEFNLKLEAVRSEFREKEELLKADLKSKENEMVAIRSGALTAMASRQISLDKRRLEAIDQIWAATMAFNPARYISRIMASVDYEKSAENSVRDPRVRELFSMLSTGVDPLKMDTSSAYKARPFVSVGVWAAFSAYSSILTREVLRMQVLKTGVGAGVLKDDGVALLLKTVLPNKAKYIDSLKDRNFDSLLVDLEAKLLEEMQKMIAGQDSDKANVAQSLEIIRMADELKSINEESQTFQ